VVQRDGTKGRERQGGRVLSFPYTPCTTYKPEKVWMNMAERKTVLLRLSPKIWEDINKWAEDEFRSVNGQIEYLLQEAVKKRKKSTSELDDNNT
jgi:hypothetical protein